MILNCNILLQAHAEDVTNKVIPFIILAIAVCFLAIKIMNIIIDAKKRVYIMYESEIKRLWLKVKELKKNYENSRICRENLVLELNSLDNQIEKITK